MKTLGFPQGLFLVKEYFMRKDIFDILTGNVSDEESDLLLNHIKGCVKNKEVILQKINCELGDLI